MSDVKLPKQWRNWCRQMNLRVHSWKKTDRDKHQWFYLKGRGFVWRVNCYGEFQRGDTYADFDRWALCKIDGYHPLPKSFDEFKNVVISLCEMHAAHLVET